MIYLISLVPVQDVRKYFDFKLTTMLFRLALVSRFHQQLLNPSAIYYTNSHLSITYIFVSNLKFVITMENRKYK